MHKLSYTAHIAEFLDMLQITSLHAAAFEGDLECVCYLIEKCKMDPNSLDIHGCGPIHYAATNSHLGVIQYLIEEHAVNPSFMGKHGFAPLYYTLSSQSFLDRKLNVVKYLIETCNVDPNDIVDFSPGCTSLHCAVFYSSLEIIQYLITHNANPNIFTGLIASPLFHAQNSTRPESDQIVKILTRQN